MTWVNTRTTRAKVTFKAGNEDYEAGTQLVATQTVRFDIEKLNSTVNADDNRILFENEDYDVLKVEKWGLGHRYLAIFAEKRDNE